MRINRQLIKFAKLSLMALKILTFSREKKKKKIYYEFTMKIYYEIYYESHRARNEIFAKSETSCILFLIFV